MIFLSKVSQTISFIKKQTNLHILDGIPTFYQHLKQFYTNKIAHCWSSSKFNDISKPSSISKISTRMVDNLNKKVQNIATSGLEHQS